MHSFKKFANIDKKIDYKTLLNILNTSNIENRINLVKVNFWYKLRNNTDSRSMTKKVFDSLLIKRDFNKLSNIKSPMANYKQIIYNLNMKALYSRNNDINNEEIKHFMKFIIINKQTKVSTVS